MHIYMCPLCCDMLKIIASRLTSVNPPLHLTFFKLSNTNLNWKLTKDSCGAMAWWLGL